MLLSHRSKWYRFPLYTLSGEVYLSETSHDSEGPPWFQHGKMRPASRFEAATHSTRFKMKKKNTAVPISGFKPETDDV